MSFFLYSLTALWLLNSTPAVCLGSHLSQHPPSLEDFPSASSHVRRDAEPQRSIKRLVSFSSYSLVLVGRLEHMKTQNWLVKKNPCYLTALFNGGDIGIHSQSCRVFGRLPGDKVRLVADCAVPGKESSGKYGSVRNPVQTMTASKTAASCFPSHRVTTSHWPVTVKSGRFVILQTLV